MIVLVLVAILALLTLLATFLWWRLVYSTTLPGRSRRRLSLLFTLLILFPLATPLLLRAIPLPNSLTAPLEWTGYIGLGFLFYLLLVSLLHEPLRLALRLFRPTKERALLLARSLAASTLALSLGITAVGVYFANSTPVVRTIPVTLANLDPELDGYRLVVFTDAHLSGTYGGERFKRLIELVNDQRPDAVAIVGDLVDGDVAALRDDAALLADLKSPDGTFFVTGNHEYYAGAQEWVDFLPSLGVQVLRNQSVTLGSRSATFLLAGVDDFTASSSGIPGHGADLEAALAGHEGASPIVLLAHQPVQVEQSIEAGVDLQISGHTHGGQLWPFDYAVTLAQPALKGLSQEEGVQLLVSSGASYWGPPIRIGDRPEILVVELHSPS